MEMPQDIIARRCKGWGGELPEFNGEVDHVRALISRAAALCQQREDHHQPPDSARLHPRSPRRYGKPNVLVADVLLWGRAVVGYIAVWSSRGRIVRPKPPSPPPWLVRMEHWRQFGES
jgi:hypothetical protein